MFWTAFNQGSKRKIEQMLLTVFLTGEYLGDLPAVWCFKCAWWGRCSDVASQMDPPRPRAARNTVAQVVVLNQITPSAISGGTIYPNAGFGTWCSLVWFSVLSDSPFRCSPSRERGLSGVDLGGSGSTGSARRPVHGRQAGHHADLHLHPQNRGEERDLAHLLLLSGNQSVERCGNRSLGGRGRVSRPPRMLFYELCRKGKMPCRTITASALKRCEINPISVEDLCDGWLPGELPPGNTATCSWAIPRCHGRSLVLLSCHPDLYARSGHVEAQNHARSSHLPRQSVPHWRTD